MNVTPAVLSTAILGELQRRLEDGREAGPGWTSC